MAHLDCRALSVLSEDEALAVRPRCTYWSLMPNLSLKRTYPGKLAARQTSVQAARAMMNKRRRPSGAKESRMGARMLRVAPHGVAILANFLPYPQNYLPTAPEALSPMCDAHTVARARGEVGPTQGITAT